jgi:hypothetical protein
MPNPPHRPHGFVEPPIGTRLMDVISARVAVHVWCGKCGNKTPLDPAALARKYGKFARLDQLERKLKCSIPTCGERRGRFCIREEHHRLIPRYR